MEERAIEILGQLRATDDAVDATFAAAKRAKREQRKLHKLAAEFAKDYGVASGLVADGDVMVAAAAPKTEPD
jgi:hypothetical protein